DRLLGINAHVALVKSGDQLRNYDKLLEQVRQTKGVVAASPSIYGQVMLTSGPRVSGVVVRGVDPDKVNQVVDIERYIRDGSLQTLKQHNLFRSRVVLCFCLGLSSGPGSPINWVFS